MRLGNGTYCKIDGKTRGKLSREAAATLKEMQKILASWLIPTCDNNRLNSLCLIYREGRQDVSIFYPKKHPYLAKVCNKIYQISPNFGPDETKVPAIIPEHKFRTHPTAHHQKNTISTLKHRTIIITGQNYIYKQPPATYE